MTVSRPGFPSAEAALLAEYGGGTVRSIAFREASGQSPAAGSGTTQTVGLGTDSGAGLRLPAGPRPDALYSRPRAPRLAATPQILTFARRQARYVRVETEPAGVAGPPPSIRTLSITDSSSPTVDLALRKHATASSAADDPGGPAGAVDGNPCTRWSPATRDERPWIRLDLGESVSFDGVCIVPDRPRGGEFAVRVSVSPDGETWAEPEVADDPLLALRIDLGASLPLCPGGDCEPLHVQADAATWQVFAVNHTAQRVTGAALTARIYEPFGRQLSRIEQRGLLIGPLSVAPGFVVSWPAYYPQTHLISLQLHDADGTLLSEDNRWRYRDGSASSRRTRRAGATAR